MTEPIDDRSGGEWAPPRPVDEPPPVEVRPADGPLPGSPVGLGGSPAGFGSPAALPGPPAPVPGSPVPAGSASGTGLAVPPADAVPVRITLPPDLRPAWASPTGSPAAGPVPAAPAGHPGWPGPPAAPGWSGTAGAPGWSVGPDPRGGPAAPGGHPLASPDWSPAGRPANPGWPTATLPRSPSGLFPSGPPRPTYRQPHPVRGSAVAIGAGAGALWMLLFGLVASSARGYAWWTISAGLAAWLCALVLARYGDRGVAVGVAASTGLGAAIAGSVVFAQFIGGNWLLW